LVTDTSFASPEARVIDHFKKQWMDEIWRTHNNDNHRQMERKFALRVVIFSPLA
jgi:hypothetical protein